MKEKKLNGFAITSLIFGILSAGFYPFVYLLTQILAIIFGVLGINKSKDLEGKGKKMSIVGIILGVLFIFQAIFYPMLFDYMRNINVNHTINSSSNSSIAYMNFAGTYKYDHIINDKVDTTKYTPSRSIYTYTISLTENNTFTMNIDWSMEELINGFWQPLQAGYLTGHVATYIVNGKIIKNNEKIYLEVENSTDHNINEDSKMEVQKAEDSILITLENVGSKAFIKI